MSARLAVLAMPALLLAVAGCAAAEQDPGLQPADPWSAKDDALQGRAYVGSERTVAGEPQPLVDGTELQIGFTDDGITAYAGCNHMSARARYADGVLTVDQVGGTEMGCDPARMDQDKWLAEFLSANPDYALEGQALTLTAGDTELQLAPQSGSDAALDDSRWVLNGVIDGAGPGASVGSVPGGVTSTLRLRDDGVVLVRTGCNSGSATADLAGDTLTLKGLVMTQIACPGTAGSVEADVLRVLRPGEIQYALDGDSLTLTVGKHGLLYRAA